MSLFAAFGAFGIVCYCCCRIHLFVIIILVYSITIPCFRQYSRNRRFKQKVAEIRSTVWGDWAAMPASTGCSANPTLPEGTHEQTILINDPLLGAVNRSFLISIPHGDHSSSLAVLFAFHAQTGSGSIVRARHTFDQLANSHTDPWLVVYPDGMADGATSGWNCGTAADDSTCVANATGASCHASCQKLGKCGRCNWSTCYSDVDFVDQLMQHLEAEFCIDADRLHL